MVGTECPLRFHFAEEKDRVCKEENCGWWNYSVQACAVAVLAMKLGREIAKSER
jgi:hypothetical protein